MKESICAQYEREIVLKNEIEEINTDVGYYDKMGMYIPGSPELGKAAHERNIKLFNQRIESKWQSEYGKYYDKNKEEAFTVKFNGAIKEYDNSVIVPMMKMYMACLEGKILTGYFFHNFDTTDPGNGICYVQSVTDCIDGFQDKLLVSKHFQERLSGECTDKTNILARAAVFNNDIIAEKINSATHASLDITAIPWDRPLDGFKDIFDQKIAGAQLVLEKYQNALSGAVFSLVGKVIDSRPADALVSFAIVANKKVKMVTLAAERKYFVTAVVGELAEIFGISGRAGIDQLRHYVDIEVRHIEATNIKMTGIQTGKFAVLVDMKEAEVLKAASNGTEASAIAKTLHSVEEVKANIFPNTFRSKLAQLKSASPSSISGASMNAIPFSGSVLSGAFQIFAITHAGLPKEFTVESTSRLAGNILMAAGSVADSIERLMTNFNNIRWNAQIRVAMGGSFQRTMMSSIRFVKWLGGAAGVVGVIFDFYNFGMEIHKGHNDIAAAYFCSAIGGGILTYAVLFSVILSPAWIVAAVILMLGAAIYLTLNIKTDIQLWLISCLWRKIPLDESAIPAIWPTGSIEIEAFSKALQSGAQ